MIIILTTLSLILGILAGHYLQPSPSVSFLLTGLSAVSFLFAYRKSNKDFIQKPYFAASSFIMAFSIGMMSIVLHYAPNQKQHYSHLLKEENQSIEGVISERLKPNDYSEKYILKVLSIEGKSAKGKIVINLPRNRQTKLLHPGDRIYCVSILNPIAKPLNPYQFDYAAYMAKQNIFHQITLKENYVIAGKVRNFDFYTESVRSTLIKSFRIHGFDKGTVNIINALLLGQRQDMDPAISKSYTDAGVIHILAISGLHITILFFILTLMLKPLKRFDKKGRLLQLIFILAFLWTFAIVSGLSASVVRSVVMFSFISIGVYINRNTSVYTSIAVSILVLLLFNPNWLFDAGFQLSYLAVTAIVLLQPLYKSITISKYRIVNYIADIIAISLIAQIGVLPLSLYYFNQFPLLFLIANSVVIPLSNIILILGIIVLALNFIFNDAALFLGNILEFLIEGMNAFIKLISSFEQFIIKDIPFSFALNTTLYTLIICSVLWLYKKSYKNTVAVLLSVVLFQGIYTFSKWQAINRDELVVFHNKNHSLIALKNSKEITVCSTDSLGLVNTTIKTYRKEYFNQAIRLAPLSNTLLFKNEKLLIIDSAGIYDLNINPDIILLTLSPKINLERVLTKLKPKQVVADATNYKNLTERWKRSCREQKIPFHATSEKGYFRID